MVQETPDDRLSQTKAGDPQTSAQQLEALSQDLRLRILVAGNPASPTHLLEELAHDQGIQVRANVAGNPNTSWPTLEALAWEFPHAFLHNPVGPLQMIANPEQINTDKAFWEAVLREAPIPEGWINWLRSQPGLSQCQAVRMHVQFAGETVHPYRVAEEEEEQVLLLLTVLCICIQEQQKIQFVLPMPRSTLAGRSVLTGEQIVQEHLQWLALSKDIKAREVVAGNSLTPVEILRALAQDDRSFIRAAVAGNKKTPPETLQTLALDRDEDVREAVARNPQTPPETLRTLAQDNTMLWSSRWHRLVPYARVRRAVANNLRAPVEILQTLAQDMDDSVRRAIVKNPQTPVEILQLLAQDRDASVLMANRLTPIERWQALALDEDADVRRLVAQSTQTPSVVLAILAQDGKATVRRLVAQNPQTPTEVLVTLVQDTDKDVRRLVAQNPRTPTEVLKTQMQRSRHASIRAAVDKNEQLSVETQQLLALDRDNLVSETFSIHQMRHKPIEEQLKDIARMKVSEATHMLLFSALAAGWNSLAIRNAFARANQGGYAEAGGYRPLLAPFLPSVVLQKLAESPCWKVRYLIALHEQTSWETMQRLCQDGNRYVRAVARAKAQTNHFKDAHYPK